MRTFGIIMTIFICFTFLGVSEANSEANDASIVGNWYGVLNIPDGPKLRLAIMIRQLDEGIRTTLISIDQGGATLPMDKLDFTEGKLRLEKSSDGIIIEGELKEDGQIFDAEFRQGGGVFPVEFKLVDEIPGLIRPQTPKPPYPYKEEEVEYEDKTSGIKFAGTLTLPDSTGPFPVALLISGSGPQDRDEFIALHRPFFVMADYLTRRGIAVLRVDDRGVGGTTGEFKSATTADFANDAMAGVQYLKSRTDINPEQIGLIGHSEGGMIAPMLASRSSDIAFIVMMAGPGMGLGEIIAIQRGLIARSEGASEEKAAVLREWYKDLYTVVKQEKDDEIVLEKMQGIYAEMSEQEKELLGWSETERAARVSQPLNPWFRYALSYDPVPILMKVKCPVLAINGEKDILVTPKENLSSIEEALKAGGNQNYTVKELPSLNHLFQTADTGAEFEYVEIAETISPSVLELISSWIAEQTGIISDSMDTGSELPIEGIWYGALEIPNGPKFRMVFEFDKRPDGRDKVTIVSLDQGSGIPVDEISFMDNELHLGVKAAGISIDGKLNQEDSVLKMEWKQGGGAFPLELKQVDEVPGFRRPQTPKKPYPYDEEEVTFENKEAEVKLAGTLTLPRSKSSSPAVLLITGSGPQDRDYILGYHRLFLVLADYLTRQGVAVLRVDDRGVGESTGDFSVVTTGDLADDVLAGIEYLKSREEIDSGHIGLIGHSEGGAIAPMVAAGSSNVAFIVMMAGPGLNGYDNLVLQDYAESKAKGATEEELALILELTKRFYAIPLQEKDNTVAEEKIKEFHEGMSEEEKQAFGWLKDGWSLQPHNAVSPWMRYYLSFDPAPFLKKQKCPVLAINGEKDVQVPPKENLKAIEEALKAGGNSNYMIKELPALNHMFQTSESGSTDEYPKIEETISPTALKLMGDWIRKQTNVDKDEGKKTGGTEKKIDSLFAQWDKPDSPGCALAVIGNGEIVYKSGYGVSNLDYNIPITPETVFDIGSIAKQFTAACIALLAEEGKLAIEDDIRKYIPEFPDYGDTITIDHLIHHTNGITDYNGLMFMANMTPENVTKEEDILDLISRQHDLDFRPGDKKSYSNSGYILLAAIIRRVTGMSIGDYAAKHIFEPLGMKNTFIYEDSSRVIRNRAIGYKPDGKGGFQMEHHFNFAMGGDGQVYTTVGDLLLWDRNLYENKIGGENFNTLMLTVGTLNNGKTIDYAFGLVHGEYKGLKTIGHGGSWAGFRARMTRFPEQKFTVIVLSNLSSVNTWGLVEKVADIYLADQFKQEEPKKERTAVSVDPAIYDSYVGEYELMPGFLLTITKEDDQLVGKGRDGFTFKLLPESETDFFLDNIANAQISFNKNESGNVFQLAFRQGDQTHLAKKIETKPPQSPDPEQLKEFAGEYYSDELLVAYRVFFDGDRLRLDGAQRVSREQQYNFKDDNEEDPLRYVEGDKFLRSCGEVTFTRDEKGEINGLIFGIRPAGLSQKFARKQSH